MWSTVGLSTLVAATIISSAPAAMAEEVTPVDDLVAQAVEVSSLPVDEAGLAAVFATMSEAQAQQLIDTQLVADSATSVVITPADATARATARTSGVPTLNATSAARASGCWTSKINRSAKAAAGNTLYTYFTTGGWCSNGSSVTSARLVERGGETSTPGWRYAGVRTGGSGVFGGQGRVYTQFQFILGAAGIDVQSPTPCARMRGNANGSATGDGVCSVS
ncbi:hypothetical protein [Modestobacter sp. Leaf380]|uniref:hypothetical protein n=1 Tax=Modestobacter sp. Leaf380 TaxID=1736356 RepID=UPI0006F8DA8C|nr:hypothetical protein [Modestobacter sp. Leaf380]KQS69243.1 hypothetical protein ASG41_21725 [Modestobacter sp. Leaf380]